MKKIIIFIALIIILGGAILLLIGEKFKAGNLVYYSNSVSTNIQSLVKSNPNTTQNYGENRTDLPLKIPAGFSISYFAKNLADARVIAPDFMGNIWVSRPNAGVVTLLELKDGQVVNQSDTLRRLNAPHGLAFDPDAPNIMYIGEESRISKIALYTEGNYEKIVDLPSGGQHSTRTLLFGKDGQLYVHIGSSCNICVEGDKKRGTIHVLNKNGSNFREFASGLRNSVFLTNHPVTGELWATDNGRDRLGDDIPPDEVNIVKAGEFYGWPYCYGNKIQDTSFDFSEDAHQICQNSESPKIEIQAHSAPLGLAFFPENSAWPEEYWNNLLVAYHGSWNRTQPTGYKIVRYKFDRDGNLLGQEDFITGWFTNNKVLGRPVDIKIQPDGKIYISDDKLGVIYLVTLTQK